MSLFKVGDWVRMKKETETRGRYTSSGHQKMKKIPLRIYSISEGKDSKSTYYTFYDYQDNGGPIVFECDLKKACELNRE